MRFIVVSRAFNTFSHLDYQMRHFPLKKLNGSIVCGYTTLIHRELFSFTITTRTILHHGKPIQHVYTDVSVTRVIQELVSGITVCIILHIAWVSFLLALKTTLLDVVVEQDTQIFNSFDSGLFQGQQATNHDTLKQSYKIFMTVY